MEKFDFGYQVADGHVALIYEDDVYLVKNHVVKPFKKTKVRKAVVVAVGGDVERVSGNTLVPGRKVLMPSINKQEFEVDGVKCYVCHYRDIKLIDPADDEELMLELLERHYESLPKSVTQKFDKKMSGL